MSFFDTSEIYCAASTIFSFVSQYITSSLRSIRIWQRRLSFLTKQLPFPPSRFSNCDMPLEKYTACSSDDGHSPSSDIESETSLFLSSSATKHERRRAYFSYKNVFLSLVILLLGLNILSILLWIMPTTKPVQDYYRESQKSPTQL